MTDCYLHTACGYEVRGAILLIYLIIVKICLFTFHLTPVTILTH